MATALLHGGAVPGRAAADPAAGLRSAAGYLDKVPARAHSATHARTLARTHARTLAHTRGHAHARTRAQPDAGQRPGKHPGTRTTAGAAPPRARGRE